MRKQGAKHSPKETSKKSPHPDDLIRTLVKHMDGCKDAETLNTQIITPFVQALEDVCLARGYILNICGEHSNLCIAPDSGSGQDSETLYYLIEEYLEGR